MEWNSGGLRDQGVRFGAGRLTVETRSWRWAAPFWGLMQLPPAMPKPRTHDLHLGCPSIEGAAAAKSRTGPHGMCCKEDSDPHRLQTMWGVFPAYRNKQPLSIKAGCVELLSVQGEAGSQQVCMWRVSHLPPAFDCCAVQLERANRVREEAEESLPPDSPRLDALLLLPWRRPAQLPDSLCLSPC